MRQEPRASRLKNVNLRRFSPLLLIGLLCVGCPQGATLENSETFNKACDARPIFLENCSGASCHGTEGTPSTPKGGIDLVSAGVEGRLLGKPASYSGIDGADLASCNASSPELLVDPNAIDKSLLLTKLNGTHRCGDRMPLGAPLEDNSIRCVRSFVAALVESGVTGQGGASAATGGTSSLGGAK